VPLLLLLRQPMPAIIPAAQAIQLPVACAQARRMRRPRARPAARRAARCAAAGRFARRQWAGQRIPVAALHRLVCLLLIATGSWFGWRA
jgi:hypothetical protein